ncbi:Outer-membrane receptor for Fe(III)-coprogen, Fe(III)-ferrioxamine B and Fe(III)-rhodotrulic acid [Kluyvera cryocrescens]|uniref:Outer-membrane receptor for Fe(III)-coprogen, Fe(III)-ferrioxamine B and Fe(III)-rhodotrulic acid n=1 Tax=Kluyvera cryocrescens TaxID=580 RepID=A0A485ALS2_KLUCR|nr:Outer-membrane receptor for Fe(III)-coprogen, Fe(III)-ferrioxamine B and Fe(III)-rhodotrulic acid [Kluyvera cryocrescens]
MHFYGREISGKPLTVLLLALAIHGFVQQAYAEEKSQEMVVYGSTESAADEQQDYAVKTTRAGTKMNLAPRDIPQSVSVVTRQRMQDQNLQTVDQVLTNATGISSQQIDSERSYYYSRGFEITNFSYDDISDLNWRCVELRRRRRRYRDLPSYRGSARCQWPDDRRR